MNKGKKWTTPIAALFAGICILGGAWFWDALDYPTPGIPKAPPTPFGYENWDWNVPVVTNLSRALARLRGNRHGRLREKWIRELKLADTYWTFRSGKFAVHFVDDGSFRVRKPSGQPPHDFEDFRSFERTHAKEIVLFPEVEREGESTRVRIQAINEKSIMLVAPSNAPMAVFDRASSSSYFDSLVDQLILPDS